MKSPIRGEIFALSEMWGHMEASREFFTTLRYEKLGPYGLTDCESLFPSFALGAWELENSSPGIFGSSWTPCKVGISEMFCGFPETRTRLRPDEGNE